MHSVFMWLLPRCVLGMLAAYRGASISLPREQGSSGLLAEREKAGEAKELLRRMVLTTEGSVMSCFTMTVCVDAMYTRPTCMHGLHVQYTPPTPLLDVPTVYW